MLQSEHIYNALETFISVHSETFEQHNGLRLASWSKENFILISLSVARGSSSESDILCSLLLGSLQMCLWTVIMLYTFASVRWRDERQDLFWVNSLLKRHKQVPWCYEVATTAIWACMVTDSGLEFSNLTGTFPFFGSTCTLATAKGNQFQVLG